MALRRSARSPHSGPIVVRLTSYRSSQVLQGYAHPLVPLRGNGQRRGSLKRELTAFLTARNTTEASESKSKHPAPVEKTSDSFLLTLTLPLPPSINHQYATVQGRRVLSSAGRRFKSHVGQEVLCLLARQRITFPLKGALDIPRFALDLRFYFMSVMRRDIDGGLKITQDALCEALGINDNRIVEVSLRKDVDATAPRMELSLRVTE
jgi:crossover junction endodeoxyribonuclease RusA